MPTYEYECIHCGHNFEAFQQMTDKPLENCPKCNKKVRRLIGAGAGIIFKGAGFYATDYRKRPKSETKEAVSQNICPNVKAGCDACKSNK